MRRCSACGRFVAPATIFRMDWSTVWPGMGAADYHPYHGTIRKWPRDTPVPCGPVR